jgi:hypothetical protein
VRLTPGAITPPTEPNAPSALAGTRLSSSQVRLTWTDNSGNELGFRVQRALGTQGTFALLSQVGANITAFTDTAVKAGKTYRYRVQAYNTAGASAWSNEISLRVRR